MSKPDMGEGTKLEQILEEVEAGRVAMLAAEERIGQLARVLEAWVARFPGVSSPGESFPPVDATHRAQTSRPGREAARGEGGTSEVDYLRLISHDLKEPLRGIVYFSQLLAEEYGAKLGQEGLDYLGYIRAAAHRMGMLLADGALLSRLKNQPLEPQPTDLEALIRALVDEFRSEMASRRGTIRREGEFPVLCCDPMAMQELLRRLLKNAIQYSKTPAEIRVAVEGPRDGFFTFTIQDRGIGIEPEYQDRVFDLFYRLHSWEEYEGTGAGLTICKRIVEIHGGRIWLESIFGEGTIAHFTLPDTSSGLQDAAREPDAP